MPTAQAIVDRHRPRDGRRSTPSSCACASRTVSPTRSTGCSTTRSSQAAEDIDLCMILGAGYPFQMGGVTPYLDRVGASERAFGDTFHHPPIRGVA